MSNVPSWQEFKQYWNSQGTRHMVVDGAVAGIVAGFLGGIILSILIWLCMRQPKCQAVVQKHTLQPHESPYFNKIQNKNDEKQLNQLPNTNTFLQDNNK